MKSTILMCPHVCRNEHTGKKWNSSKAASSVGASHSQRSFLFHFWGKLRTQRKIKLWIVLWLVTPSVRHNGDAMKLRFNLTCWFGLDFLLNQFWRRDCFLHLNCAERNVAGRLFYSPLPGGRGWGRHGSGLCSL